MTTIEKVSHAEIKPLLGVMKTSGSDILAFCPAHSDGQKHGMKSGHSLILHASGVLECKAGCSFADVMTALRKRAPRELAPVRRSNGVVAAKPKDDEGGWQTFATYEYRDPVTYEVVAIKSRQERPLPDPEPGTMASEKRFRWRTPGGAFTLVGHTHSVNDMALWGAEVVKERAGQRVWVAEGEKATKAIRDHGELAVCGGWGASTQDWSANMAPWEVLRNRNVILWPDNDAPGRAYMQAVRRALRGIAKSVAVVTAPVPPKGDAYEYFQQPGATIEALLADVLTEPAADVLGDGDFAIRIPNEGGVLRFHFTQMATVKNALECNLTVSVPWADDEYDQWINLKSQSTREGLKRALDSIFGKDTNWTAAISTAYTKVRAAYELQDRGIHVTAMTELPTGLFLVEDLLPLGSATVLFGKGSSGKTALSKRIALEVAWGGKILGKRCQQTGVLMIDYEDPDWLKHDLRRHLVGMGQEPGFLEELPIHYWPHRNEPIATQAEAIKRYCDKHNIGFIVVDSALSACGGEPERSEPSAAVFNALNHIGRTVLIISHTGHAEYDAGMRRPYGHINWENRPRRVWAIHRDDNAATDAIDFLLTCTKTNRKMPANIGGTLVFEGEANRGPIGIIAKDVRTNATLRARISLPENIRGLLLHGPRTVSDIAKELDIDLADASKLTPIRVALHRMKDVMCIEEGHGKVESRWALLVPGERRPEQTEMAEMDPCSRCGKTSVGYGDAGQSLCAEHL